MNADTLAAACFAFNANYFGPIVETGTYVDTNALYVPPDGSGIVAINFYQKGNRIAPSIAYYDQNNVLNWVCNDENNNNVWEATNNLTPICLAPVYCPDGALICGFQFQQQGGNFGFQLGYVTTPNEPLTWAQTSDWPVTDENATWYADTNNVIIASPPGAPICGIQFVVYGNRIAPALILSSSNN